MPPPGGCLAKVLSDLILSSSSRSHGATIMAKSSWSAAEMAANVLCHPSKTLVNHPVNENDGPLPPEKCWILKIRHNVGRIVPQCQVIGPISRDKSTFYGGRGGKG